MTSFFNGVSSSFVGGVDSELAFLEAACLEVLPVSTGDCLGDVLVLADTEDLPLLTGDEDDDDDAVLGVLFCSVLDFFALPVSLGVGISTPVRYTMKLIT